MTHLHASLAITSVPVSIHSTRVMLMPMLLLILNDEKLFWVIVLQLDIVCLRIAKIMYRIAGKFGGELNLAVWRSILQPPN